MLISHTGDVTETRAGMAAIWVLVLTDRTSGMELIVHCKGQMIEAAKLAKIGQVIEVVGITNRLPATRGFAVNPIILRAKSGTNEADINKIASEYTNNLLDGKSPVLEAEVTKWKAEATSLLVSVTNLRTERDGLVKKVEVLDRDLQAERIMNSVMGGTT